MCPSADDNYGDDACDILHLDSSPEVLVIATASGSLIHGIILSSQEDDEVCAMAVSYLFIIINVVHSLRLDL